MNLCYVIVGDFCDGNHFDVNSKLAFIFFGKIDVKQVVVLYQVMFSLCVFSFFKNDMNSSCIGFRVRLVVCLM